MSAGTARPLARGDGENPGELPACARRLPVRASLTATAIPAAARGTKWLEPGLLGPATVAVPGGGGLLEEVGGGGWVEGWDCRKGEVEGAELHVLRGGKNVIEAFRPAMLIEIEGRHTDRYG